MQSDIISSHLVHLRLHHLVHRRPLLSLVLDFLIVFTDLEDEDVGGKDKEEDNQAPPDIGAHFHRPSL